MIEVIVYLIILATALPACWLLAWLCDDEIIKDRKYFIFFGYFIIIVAILLMLFNFNIPMLFSMAYLLIVLAILARAGRKNKVSINNKKK